MKLLWVKTDFLHPTTRGGQIRTLEMLRRLHRKHEVHYVALAGPEDQEGIERAGEYSSFSYPVPHQVVSKTSLAFAGQLIGGLFSELPVAVSRYQSGAMRQRIAALTAQHRFDGVVCDFLFPAPSLPSGLLGGAVLFQHNVEAMIWQRHAEHAATPLHGWYFRGQARRMLAYEGSICRQARRVIAVSEPDARAFERLYGCQGVRAVSTGVDVDFFRPPEPPPPPQYDLVFLGSMDWMPNSEGMRWFVESVWPLITARRPDARLAIVGRRPGPEIEALGQADARITVSGTVPDVRPWLHASRVSIVPLRIGGGTRLKIYEAMAAGVPVVSTTIGAEGLAVEPGRHLEIADDPAALAAACERLLAQPEQAAALAAAARRHIEAHYSWEAVTGEFEELIFS
ncbi:MAG: glycosyltransferase [Bryobacteraceae bacterium]|nr:glycosyltransferase [Bryobacteraceae bacterium]